MKLFLKGSRCITEKCCFVKRSTPGNAYPEAGKVKLLCFTAAGKTEGETDLRDAGKAV